MSGWKCETNHSINQNCLLKAVLLILLSVALFPLGAFGDKDVENKALDQSNPDVSFELRIVQRKIVGELGTIKVKQGQKVQLSWLSDEDVALHLHGYDIQQSVIANTPTAIIFDAYATGRFSITSHGFGHQQGPGSKHHHALIYLEVHPK